MSANSDTGLRSNGAPPTKLSIPTRDFVSDRAARANDVKSDGGSASAIGPEIAFG